MPVLMLGMGNWCGERNKSRIKAVQIENLRGLLSIKVMLNVLVRKSYKVNNGLDESVPGWVYENN